MLFGIPNVHSHFVHLNMVLEYPDDDSSESKHVTLKYNWCYTLCVDWNLKLN